MKCIACGKPVSESDYHTHAATDEYDAIHLCLACYERVVRGGRTPRQTAEAV